MQDRFLTRYYDTKTEQIIKLNTIINTCENGIDIEFYGICVSGDGQISQVELDKNEQRFKRMQCTGLKDKNGKLIYEGDIVSVKVKIQDFFGEDEYYSENYKGKIIFEKGEIAIDVIDITRHLISLFFNIKGCEVIGNIYENPELIGGAK